MLLELELNTDHCSWEPALSCTIFAGTGTGTETRPYFMGPIRLFLKISCSLQSLVTKKVILYVNMWLVLLSTYCSILNEF